MEERTRSITDFRTLSPHLKVDESSEATLSVRARNLSAGSSVREMDATLSMRWVGQTPRTWLVRVAMRTSHRLPAIVSEFPRATKGWAPRSILRCDLDREGMIKEFYVILASRKLLGMRFGSVV